MLTLQNKPVRFNKINPDLIRFEFGLVLTIQNQNKDVFSGINT